MRGLNGFGLGHRLSAEGADKESKAFEVIIQGNPFIGDQAVAEIRGAGGQSIQMTLTDINGNRLMQQDLKIKSNQENHTISINGKSTGLYLLRMANRENTVTIKLIKQ